MRPSPYGRRPARVRTGSTLMAPIRWLTRLNPVHSWLVVMAVIVGLSVIGLRWLALLVAVSWTGYAAYTWLKPTARRRIRGWLRRWQ